MTTGKHFRIWIRKHNNTLFQHQNYEQQICKIRTDTIDFVIKRYSNFEQDSKNKKQSF